MTDLAPLIVGGTGGSGTRLVAQMLQSVGVQLGSDLNSALDAVAFLGIYEKHIGPWLTRNNWRPEVFDEDLKRALDRHRSGINPSGPWGWKNPRSIYLLPLWEAFIPGFRFIHVIRDGLTMADSPNQNQLRKHGPQVLDAETEVLPTSWQSLLLWARVNASAADFGEMEMDPDRYYRIRYEDATRQPLIELQQLARWLRLPEPAGCQIEVTPGRRRELGFPSAGPAHFRESVRDALKRFEYSC